MYHLYIKFLDEVVFDKYDREYLSRVFNNLYTKKKFKNKLFIKDFPLLLITRYLKSHYGVIDLDNDSDAKVNEELFINIRLVD